MAQGKNMQVLFMSQDVKARMPHETVTDFVTQLGAYGIDVVNVDPDVDTGTQVETAPYGRIVGYFGHSSKDIRGLAAATKRGGLALVMDGPANEWCTREEGHSFPFGQCLEVRQPSNALRAIQAAVGGF